MLPTRSDVRGSCGIRGGPSCRVLAGYGRRHMRVSRFLTAAARTFACFARAVAAVTAAATSCFLGAGNLSHVAILVLRATPARTLATFAATLLNVTAALTLGHLSISTAALTALHVGQTTCLGVHITNLLVALGVEGMETLTGGRAKGFLEVRIQATPTGLDLLRDTVVGIDILRLLGRLVLAVEVGQSVGEAIGDTVLAVESEGALDGLVTDHVTLSQILCHNARARLVLLRDVVKFGSAIVALLSSFASGQLVEASCAGHLDLRRTKLCVVE